MAADHRLAGRRQVELADLRGEPMSWARRAPREWINWWAVSPRPDGSEPVFGPPNDNVEELLEYVAAGPGICIVPRSIAEYYPRPGMVWLPLADADPLRIAIGWPVASRNPLVTEFAAVVRELAHADGRFLPAEEPLTRWDDASR
jgi:DNA-binding transcriptional LysR family regulator